MVTSSTAEAEAYTPSERPAPAPAAGSPRATSLSRPGLATAWGEDVDSRISYTEFSRASDAPYDTATIWYNDARMLGAQLDRAAAQGSSFGLGPRQDGVRVSLRDERGIPLAAARAGDRVFVLGEAGQRYTVLVENRTPARFETLLTVDGLDVVTGQPGSFSGRGYILQPYGRLEVRGFRQSVERVAAFRFGAVADSYAADRGDARNVGVIGVALFAERGASIDLDAAEVELRANASPFPNGFAPPPARRVW